MTALILSLPAMLVTLIVLLALTVSLERRIAPRSAMRTVPVVARGSALRS